MNDAAVSKAQMLSAADPIAERRPKKSKKYRKNKNSEITDNRTDGRSRLIYTADGPISSNNLISGYETHSNYNGEHANAIVIANSEADPVFYSTNVPTTNMQSQVALNKKRSTSNAGPNKNFIKMNMQYSHPVGKTLETNGPQPIGPPSGQTSNMLSSTHALTRKQQESRETLQKIKELKKYVIGNDQLKSLREAKKPANPQEQKYNQNKLFLKSVAARKPPMHFMKQRTGGPRSSLHSSMK